MWIQTFSFTGFSYVNSALGAVVTGYYPKNVPIQSEYDCLFWESNKIPGTMFENADHAMKVTEDLK